MGGDRDVERYLSFVAVHVRPTDWHDTALTPWHIQGSSIAAAKPDTKLGGDTKMALAFQLVNDNGVHQDHLVAGKDCCPPVISAAHMSLRVMWLTGLRTNRYQRAILLYCAETWSIGPADLKRNSRPGQ
jgi:hypothetical protein